MNNKKLCKICEHVVGDNSNFIKLSDYGNFAQTVVDFPSGHEYSLKPTLIYVDELEATDGYYHLAMKYFGLTIRENYIEGIEVSAITLSAGFVGLLRSYGFKLKSVERGKYYFNHISLN